MTRSPSGNPTSGERRTISDAATTAPACVASPGELAQPAFSSAQRDTTLVSRNYEAATAALREDTQQWWADTLARDPAELEEDEEPYTADAEGLRRFLEGEVLPWFDARKKELANRPLMREQAFGEALDPDKLERLGRYEVHLDRKLERTLAMLLRLKDLRREATAG